MNDAANDTDIRCLQCDYNLTGVESARCPECGWTIDPAVLKIARDPSVAATQRSMLIALCGVVGLLPFGVLAALLWSDTSLRRQQTIPIAVLTAFAVTTAACAIQLLTVAFYIIPTARSWPIRRPAFAFACRIIAMAQLISATALIVVSNTYGLAGLVLGWPAATAIGWVLLLATAMALAGKDEVVRQARLEQSRRTAREERGAPFVVHVAGRFLPEHIGVAWDDTVRQTGPDIETNIETAWTEERQTAERNNRLLYNGPVGRLVAFAAQGSRLVLSIGATDYRDFVGTNVRNPEVAATHGAQYLADPLGTSATVVTADGYLLYGRRGRRVAFHGGRLHTFGGMLEPQDKRPDNGYDVFAAVRRELCEELHLTEEEIADVVCTGLVRDARVLQPELLFDAEVRLTKNEILSRFDAGTDDEHSAIEACLDEPEAIIPFVNRAEPIVPVALAGILLHGRSNWGLDWYESTAYVLFGDLPKHEAQPHIQ